MYIVNHLLSRFRYWKIETELSKAVENADQAIHPNLLLKLLDSIFREGLLEYQIKDGYHIVVESYYDNVEVLMNDLQRLQMALQQKDLRPINRILIRKSVKPKILADYLVNSNNYIIPIITLEETLRNSLLSLMEVLVAADEETQHYYLRKLTNILRECYVVADALHQAGELRWRQTIKRLLSF